MELTMKWHVWEAISPITNEVHYGNERPTLEQEYWKDFKYCESGRTYTLEVTDRRESKFCSYPEGKPFRILWTDNDDDLHEKYVSTQEEADRIVKDIKNCECWRDMETMLELLEFERF